MRFPLIPTAAALTLAALPLPAQLRKGADAPRFEFDAGFHGAPDSFDSFAGRLVLIEFFATW